MRTSDSEKLIEKTHEKLKNTKGNLQPPEKNCGVLIVQSSVGEVLRNVWEIVGRMLFVF